MGSSCTCLNSSDSSQIATKVFRKYTEHVKNRKEMAAMSVLAKPGDSLPVIEADKAKEFIKEFNNSKPTKEMEEVCRKAGKLFGPAK